MVGESLGEAGLQDVIEGSLVFTGERSAKSYRLNRMANTLRSAEARARFLADEAGYMREMGARRRKWRWCGGGTGRR